MDAPWFTRPPLLATDARQHVLNRWSQMGQEGTLGAFQPVAAAMAGQSPVRIARPQPVFNPDPSLRSRMLNTFLSRFSGVLGNWWSGYQRMRGNQ